MSDEPYVPRVAWLVGGHSFDRNALERLFTSLACRIDLYEWPDASRFFSLQGAMDLSHNYDVLALYDMPGIVLERGSTPTLIAPTEDVRRGWAEITQRGIPILALHHAIASWPSWEGFAEIIKGRFHYVPGTLRGRMYPDSGYAMNVRQTLSIQRPDHPICAGLPTRFELTDETYQCPIFEDDVEILVSTDAPRDDAHHLSSLAAVRRESNSNWKHDSASPAVVWTHAVDNSRVVYLQPGDGAAAFDNENYRRLLSNTIHWLTERNPLS